MGRHEEAIAEVRHALELDPLSVIIHTALGDVLFYARRYDEAIAVYRRSEDNGRVGAGEQQRGGHSGRAPPTTTGRSRTSRG